ncbi:MAG: hypothetical protein HY820_13515 [Acidobacteria bacterium]|nr:hypothetical protein [Acidobacteriota bacterium]
MIVPEYQVTAVNTATEHENRIHSDAVAVQYGFRGGLVPGVNIYGCLTVPVVRHWGEHWLNHGWMNVRFREPFYEGELVTVASALRNQEVIAITAGRASAEAGLHREPIPALPAQHPLPAERPSLSRALIQPGAPLGSLQTDLRETNLRIVAALHDPLPHYNVWAHPAVILGLANDILVRNFLLPAWIHTASEVHNYRAAPAGETVEVRGVIREAFEKKGHEFLTVEIAILSDKEDLFTSVRHTAIWQPRLVK